MHDCGLSGLIRTESVKQWPHFGSGKLFLTWSDMRWPTAICNRFLVPCHAPCFTVRLPDGKVTLVK